jgi:hypothetical protein
VISRGSEYYAALLAATEDPARLHLTDQFAMLLSICINLRASAGAALF